MDHTTSNGLRTRSKAAPDWTVEESLILVNEIAAIEADCRGTLSSFQKWKIIVENCNALDVNRNLNQCRRKWDSLLSDYRKIKQSGSKKASFNSELFKAIEMYVREFDNGDDSDSDGPPMPEPQFADGLLSGSSNQRDKVKSQKQIVEVKGKSTRSIKSEDMEVEECSSEKRENESMGFVKMNREEHERNMADKLRETAKVMEAIVNGDNDTYELTRMNGDNIIICLSNLAVTLDELCKLQMAN